STTSAAAATAYLRRDNQAPDRAGAASVIGRGAGSRGGSLARSWAPPTSCSSGCSPPALRFSVPGLFGVTRAGGPGAQTGENGAVPEVAADYAADPVLVAGGRRGRLRLAARPVPRFTPPPRPVLRRQSSRGRRGRPGDLDRGDHRHRPLRGTIVG